MARGWESKDVESQIESLEKRGPQKTPADFEALRIARERESIELSIRRVQHDLEAAQHSRHKAQLEAAIAHLEQQKARLIGGG